MEPKNTSESAAETEAIKPKDFFSRLGGVYLSPKNAFREIGSSPSVVLPILVILILGFLLAFYLTRTLDLQSSTVASMEKMVEKGIMTKEMMESALPDAIKSAPRNTLIAGTVMGLIYSLLFAGFAKLISLFMSAENRFKSILSVTLFSMIAITIIQSVLTVAILHFKGTADVDFSNMDSLIVSNLGAFFSSDALPKPVLGLARAIDIFAIWEIVLLAIGYSAVSRKLKTATACAWLAIPYLIFKVVNAAFNPFQ